MNLKKYFDIIELYRNKELSREEFDKKIIDITKECNSPLKEYYIIYSYLHNNNYYIPKDKREYLIKNSLIILNSDLIDDNNKMIIKCALMNAFFSNYNYEKAEKYANELLNILSKDLKILQHLADYYTKTRRYEIAGSIYKFVVAHCKDNMIKEYADYNSIINKKRKPYIPVGKDNQEKYFAFLKLINIYIEKDYLTKKGKKQPEKIKVGEYPLPVEIFSTDFNSFVAFDLETTGVDHSKDAIIEIAAIKVLNGKIVESKDFTFQELVKPYKKRIPEEVEKLTGITNDMVSNARKIWEVFPEFAEFIGDNVLVGYNCMTFDSKFLVRAGRLSNLVINNKYFDVMHFARKYRSTLNIDNMTLVQVGKALGIENSQAHRALADAITTAKIYLKLLKIKDYSCE